MRRTNKQSGLLHLLLRQLKIDKEGKQELVFAATGGRSTSSWDLTVQECTVLCKQLSEKAKTTTAPAQVSPKPKTEKQWTSPEDRMRKKILSIGHELGLKLNNGSINMARVNAICVERGYLHKKLDLYTRAELPKLIAQFENILRDHYKSGAPC
jgi:hypothetical protein